VYSVKQNKSYKVWGIKHHFQQYIIFQLQYGLYAAIHVKMTSIS
jgi:hypothetical protein